MELGGAELSMRPSRRPYCKKKISGFPVPSRDVTDQILPGRGIIKLFTARECLVSDIPAGDGKIDSLFLQCTLHWSSQKENN